MVDFDLTDDGTAFIAMELLRGENLSQRLEREQRLGLARTMRFLEQAASALQAVHAAGVVHRDLKPSNLFLHRRDDGTELVKLLDFGISKITGASTLTGDDLLGTPFYMSPEQAEGRHYLVDFRTDVFSMGSILYRVLSGQRPFEAESVPAMLFQIVHEPATPLHETDAAIPREIAEVVDVAMAKDPNRRFCSMKALAEAFAAVVEKGDTICGARGPTRTYPAAGSPGYPPVSILQPAARRTPASMPRPVARPTPESMPRPVSAATPHTARRRARRSGPGGPPPVNAGWTRTFSGCAVRRARCTAPRCRAPSRCRRWRTPRPCRAWTLPVSGSRWRTSASGTPSR